jgi:hypothetical protein
MTTVWIEKKDISMPGYWKIRPPEIARKEAHETLFNELRSSQSIITTDKH